MQLILSYIMEPQSFSECVRNPAELENISETTGTASDRESSIESFHTNKSELSITTETELIDVDDIELSDEESWLYKSPKKLTSEEKSASTEKCRRKSIDDMDDLELKETRTALLSKLNQLKMLNCSLEEKEIKKETRSSSVPSCVEKKFSCFTDTTNCNETASKKNFSDAKAENSSSTISKEMRECSAEQLPKKAEALDVVDVLKIARLQEESLKQSTYRFLSQAGKKTASNRDLSFSLSSQNVSLNKPASVEALNTCSDKPDLSNVYSMVPLQGIKKQNMFSSSSALNCSQEFHRGSLPNINRGYYSLKSKKSKHPSEPKISCPLPKHPSHSKSFLNGTVLQAPSNSHPKSAAPYDHSREARTLPSSYRVHSRSNSSHRRDVNCLPPSPRRDSSPYLSNSSLESNFRDNHRKYSSPSTVTYQKYNSSSATVSPTKAFNSQLHNLRSPPGLEYHKVPSHSPTKRMPLSPVQHQSPKKGGNFTFPRNGEIRTLKVPSKIPSPASRSGIPVPSSYSSKGSEDDNWSQDCF